MKLVKLSTLITLLFITYFSLKTPDGNDLPTNDKVGHFLAYTVLSIHLLLLSKNKRGNIAAFLFAIFYGLIMEFCQGFIPHREQSFYDILANTFGVLVGLVVIIILKKRIVFILEKMRIIKVK